MRASACCAVLALLAGLTACTGEAVRPRGEPSPAAEPAARGDARSTPQTSPSPTPSTRSPAATSRPTTPQASPTAGGGTPTRTRVTVVGDIMLGRGVGDVAAASGDVSAPLRPMQARLRRADITVGNLESTLSRAGAPRQGGDSFAAPPAVVRGLADAGFDVLSLANNHTGDFGRVAFLRTLRRIDRSPIERVGAGRDRARAWRPAVVVRNGVRFGFLAFNAIGETPRATPSQPGAAEVRMQPRTGPLSRADLRRARRAITALNRDRADVVVVLPHWGDQYTHVPVPDQRRVGRALVDAGADVVVGGHPHWVQRVQRHRDTVIAHSLGNFVFDMDFMRETMEGVVADLVFVGDRLRRVRFTPYALGSDFAPRVVRGPRARAVLRPLGVPRVVRLGR